jgi:hypothetical protein
MSNYETRILHKDEYDLWDELVDNSMQSSIFHKAIWIATSAKLLNKKFLIFGNFENNNLIGGCNIFLNQHYSFRSATSNLLLSPYCGFLIRQGKEKKAFSICQSISNKFIEYNLIYINIINSPLFKDVRPFTWNGWIPNIFYTYMMPLDGSIEQIISKNSRWWIRRARKEGIKCKIAYDFDLYWDLTLDTYGKQERTPPFTRDYLSGMMNMIIENKLGEMHIAETSSGEPAAAEFITWDQHFAHHWSAASNSKFKQTGASSLLQFEIWEKLQQRGFKMANIMTGNTKNLTEFISGFNPLLAPYFGVTKISRKYQLLSKANGLWHAFRSL